MLSPFQGCKSLSTEHRQTKWLAQSLEACAKQNQKSNPIYQAPSQGYEETELPLGITQEEGGGWVDFLPGTT
jgi:hypothetical protein